MSNDIDDRKIEDLLFAQEDSLLNRESFCATVRRIFLDRGARTAQDVIDLGCTGLVGTPVDTSIPDAYRLLYKENSPVAQIAFARGRMAGAGFGIPCYVPPTRFCLVHNTVGGLQPNQAGRHPEGLNLCSRPLTLEEQGHTADVQALIDKEGIANAKRLFGAESIEPSTTPAAQEVPTVAPAVPTITPAVPTTASVTLSARFVCPEHTTLVWACRYCLAAAVINGPIQPEVFLESQHRNDRLESWDIEDLQAVLADLNCVEVTAVVRAKRWMRKMVETDE